MEYIKEDQILLDEELRAIPLDETNKLVQDTIRFRKNIRLANKIASQFSYPRDNSLDREDILQEAYINLWKACQKFDESRGYEFSTYAVPVIQGNILRMLRETQPMRIPRGILDIRSALSKYQFSLPLSDEEIDILHREEGISKKRLIEYSDVSVSSYEEITYTDKHGDTLNLKDIIPDKSIDILNSFSENEIIEIIDRILLYMHPSQRDMIEEWMYAVLAGEKVNQMTLATKYKISQAQVSRILSSTIKAVHMCSDEIRELFGL